MNIKILIFTFHGHKGIATARHIYYSRQLFPYYKRFMIFSPSFVEFGLVDELIAVGLFEVRRGASDDPLVRHLPPVP